MKELSNSQFGFRSGKSKQDVISTLINETAMITDNITPSHSVFGDLVRAFDTVSHSKLLEAFNGYSLAVASNALFRSYLANLLQYVKICSKVNVFKDKKYGIPQRTVLGPNLFNL